MFNSLDSRNGPLPDPFRYLRNLGLGQVRVANPNKLINGDMRIDQRFSGAAQGLSNTNNYIVDRWVGRAAGANITGAQDGASPPGFNTSFRFSVGTGVAPAASDLNFAYQVIEGLNCQDLNWGTLSAKPVTFSFWVISSLTGMFSGSLNNIGLTRSYPFTYTINKANTWEYKKVTVLGDTGGTWLITNGIGLYVILDLGSGSTLQGPAGSWAGATYVAATGAKQLAANTSATFAFSGAKLETGKVATPYIFDDYATALEKCQRYYFKNVYSAGSRICAAFCSSTTDVDGGAYRFPVPMRTAPSISVPATGPGAGQAVFLLANASNPPTGGTLDVRGANTHETAIICNGTAGMVLGNGTSLYTPLGCIITGSAEL